MRYCEYDASRSRPNIVVDGSPNEQTVSTLTHWPGIPQPDWAKAEQTDLSAQMAFELVRRGIAVGADVVTNNHFDQDGLVSVLTLVEPELALAHEALLTDVAAAGDFATYRDRRAARASMVISAFADQARSPIAAQLVGPYDDQCARLYDEMLGRLLALVLDPTASRDLWGDEDDHLARSEAAIARGTVTVDEHRELDLAVVSVGDAGLLGHAHRFAANDHGGVHPMAIHNATSCVRILQECDRQYTYTDRYETWVQYRSRRLPRRVDLRPLAERLTASDPDATWTASSPSALTPQLTSNGESALGPAAVFDDLRRHLLTSPPAWDPYVPGR
jgi:hypothetical protein